MREGPPQQLADLLKALDLATPDQLRQVRRRAVGLARQLPLFESVWVDALAQARLLTPYQAAEINAGRGESLALGPFVLCQPVPSPAYASCFGARRRGSSQFVRLAVATCSTGDADTAVRSLQTLAALHPKLTCPHLAPIQQAGIDAGRIWASSSPTAGRTAADWMVSNGRFSPEIVLEIARQMLVGLVAFHDAGVCHGDIGATSTLLTDLGDVVLPEPGLRAVLRPEEGYAFADLLPEAYDYLAPERIASGTPPDVAGDVYACGCLWWHMLAGRPPIPGGNSLAKLRAAQTTAIPDIGSLAPETPSQLASAISAAVQPDPRSRPESIRRLADLLGPPARTGPAILASYLHRRGEQLDRWAAPVGAIRQWRPTPIVLAIFAGCLLAAGAVGWSLWPAPSATPLAAGSTKASQSPPGALSTTPGAAPLASTDPARPAAPDLKQNPPRADRAGPSAPTAASPHDDPSATPSQRLVLPADGAVAIDPKALLANQLITGAPGTRPLVAVPSTGLHLSEENLQFNNVDFVWEVPATATPPKDAPAMIHFDGSRINFRGCSFRAARADQTLPVAIRWTYPADANRAELSLPSGEIRLTDCVFRHVAVGIACRTHGALALNLSNTLYLGRGPLLQLGRWPQVDEPTVMRLKGITLRESGPLLQATCPSGQQNLGTVTILADGCVLVPAADEPLIGLQATAAGDSVIRNLRWTGQGSLVTLQTPVACSRDADGTRRVLDDAAISIAGLVRGTVQFAGDSSAACDASRAVRWQGALQSADAPGIDPARLAEPKR